MSRSDEDDEEERDSPLPTPTLPLYLEQAFKSFSFGGQPSSTASNGGQPGGGGSNFPDYCIPRRPSGSMWTNGIEGIAQGVGQYELNEGRGGDGRRRSEVEDVNPSPVYPALNSDGTWVEQTASTPTAEREKFEYPIPQQEGDAGGLTIPTRPSATPNTTRRGSISLPNLHTTSDTLHSLPPPTLPPSHLNVVTSSSHSSQSSSRSSSTSSSSSSTPFSFSPSLLHPHTSPFYNPSTSQSDARPLSPSLNLILNFPNHQQQQGPPRRISLTRSLSSSRPPLPTGSPSSSQTHFHPPPTHRFHPSTAPAPVPPSLKNHPALQGGRRGSLPALSFSSTQNLAGFSPPPGTGTGMMGGKRVSEGGIGTFAMYASGVGSKGAGLGGRRGSLAEKGLKERIAEEEERSRVAGRPRLGSIPSFGSDGSGSSEGSGSGSGGKTPT